VFRGPTLRPPASAFPSSIRFLRLLRLFAANPPPFAIRPPPQPQLLNPETAYTPAPADG
jgi:hypothetical protein